MVERHTCPVCRLMVPVDEAGALMRHADHDALREGLLRACPGTGQEGRDPIPAVHEGRR